MVKVYAKWSYVVHDSSKPDRVFAYDINGNGCAYEVSIWFCFELETVIYCVYKLIPFSLAENNQQSL